MMKQIRYLLWVAFFLCWHGSLLEGFLVPPAVRTPSKSHRNRVGTTRSTLAPNFSQTSPNQDDDDAVMGREVVSENQKSVLNSTNDLESLDAPSSMRSDVERMLHRKRRRTRLPLKELIAQLDDRGIRYPPTASRNELEVLLSGEMENEVHQETSNPVDAEHNAPAQSVTASSTGRARSLQSIIQTLDELGIRYPPTATKADLERLLQQYTSDDAASTTRRAERPSSLQSIIQELDEREIRYPPTATRADLERLLQQGSSDVQRPHDRASTARSTRRVGRARSLQSIIRELDERNIRYPPTALRVDLERLLQQSSSDDEQQQPRVRTSTTRSSRRTERPRSLQSIIHELDEREIRYTPTATRADLERLLRQSSSFDAQKPSGTRDRKAPSRATRRAERARSLQSIIQELDERDIRYSPTATRSDLEALLSMSNQTPVATADATASRTLESLIAELDRREIRYPPTATRADLERLLESDPGYSAEQRRQRRRRRKSLEPKDPIKTILKKSSQVASKGARQVSKIASRSNVTSRLSKVAERAARQARHVSRRAADFWNEDENGIREPEWSYISVNEPIDVPAVRLDEEDRRDRKASQQAREPTNVSRTPPRARKARPAGKYNERPSRHRQRERPQTPYSCTRGSSAAVKRPGGSLFRLPPTSEDTVSIPDFDGEHSASPFADENGSSKVPVSEDEQSGRTRRRRDTRGSKPGEGKRRIYSPYDGNQEEEGDVFDQFGNMIADTADRLLWGPDDEDDTNHRPRERKGRKPRYWRDRLAEQVDYALGIHEDGKYYNSWEKQLERDERQKRGRSSSQRRSNGNRGAPSRRHKQHNRPFWEENGNILALLLGRTSNRDYLAGRKEMPMVTTFFNSAFRAALLVITYICRWASVRGAIPQPIVVAGAASALLCARPGRRLWTVALTLVALRTAGELVHGYVYGDEGWEDDEDWDEAGTGEAAEGDDPKYKD